jgi:hypothetical protein
MCAGAAGLDSRLQWMLPGGPARPWFAATPARRDFLSRLMSVLLGGPLERCRGAALAWLAVEAAPAAAFAYPCQDGGGGTGGGASSGDGDSGGGAEAGAASQPAVEAAAGGPGGPADAVTEASAAAPQHTSMDWDQARGAVKEILSQQRQSAVLFGAYAALEAAAGQHKAARRAYDAALAAAVGQVRAKPFHCLKLAYT